MTWVGKIRKPYTDHRTRQLSAAVLVGLVGAGARWRYAHQRSRTGSGPGVITDDGVRLHVELDGRVDAPVTVVLAHGFAVTMGEYDRQREALRADARLVLFDQRGHGRSGWGSFRAGTLARLGRDLGTVVDECSGTGPVVLVGHSLGAMAVLALAQQRPEIFGDRVVATALISGSAGGVVPGAPRPVTRRVSGTSVLRVVGWALWLVTPITDRLGIFGTGLGRRVLRHFLFGTEPPTDDVFSQVQRMWALTPRGMTATLYPTMLSHDTSDALPVLGRIPCLVLTGADDRTIAPGHSERIAAEAGPTARLVRVPRAGHMVNMTHAQEVDDALRKLLERAREHRT